MAKPASNAPKFMSLRLKLLLPILALLTVIFIVAYVGLSAFLNNTVFGILDEESKTIIDSVTACLDGDMMAEMNADYGPGVESIAPGDVTDERYFTIMDCLDDAHQYNPRAELFTYQQNANGELMVMVDAVATWDDNESYWLNDPYWIEDEIEQEFMENGLVESDLGGMLFEEEDGNWYETFAPVKTSSGAPAGGIGLYMKANDLVERLEALNTWMILAFIIIYALVVALVFYITGRVTRRLITLSVASDRVAAGDYTPLNLPDLKLDDEADRLAVAFNAMMDKVRVREETLQARVTQLEIQIDESRKAQQVSEIVDTEFFQDLAGRAAAMRQRRQKPQDESGPTEPKA